MGFFASWVGVSHKFATGVAGHRGAQILCLCPGSAFQLISAGIWWGSYGFAYVLGRRLSKFPENLAGPRILCLCPGSAF